MASKDEQKRSNAERQRRFRERQARNATVTDSNATVTHDRDIAEAEAEADINSSSLKTTTSPNGSDAADSGKKPKEDYRDLIQWNPEEGFSGITEAIEKRWSIAYPACNLTSQIARASEWLMANPAKRKSKPGRFLVNWLSRAQERGGDIPSNAKNSRRESNSNIGTTNEGKAKQYAL